MQVVAGGVKPPTSAAFYKGVWVKMLQVPKAALAMQNGMRGESHISMLPSPPMDLKAQPHLPCFKFEYVHSSLIPHIRNFDCRAFVTAPSEASTHVVTPDDTEGHLNVGHEAGHLNGHPQAQGPDEISPKFAEALRSFEDLHSQLQTSRVSNSMGQAEVDALEASLGSMEAVMSNASPHEYWHMGSAWLKLAWLYSDAPDTIKEPLTRVITSGHQALKFLEALQTPVWTIVSCCYVLAHTNMRVGKFEDAVYLLEKATSVIKDLEPKGPPNPEQAQLVSAVHSLSRDAKIRFGQNLCTRVREYLVGDKDTRLFCSRVSEALELVTANTDPDSVVIAAQCENCLGIFYLQSQQANEAVPHFKNSLSKLTRIHGQNSSKLAIAHNHLGVAYTDLCKLNDALKHFEAAKKILSRCTLEKGDGTEVTLYNNIAQVYALRGRFHDAITAQKRLIEIIKQNMKDNIETPFHLDAAEETLQEMMQQANERT